jgi:phosphoribosyl-ATP pyrophosphohydrolase
MISPPNWAKDGAGIASRSPARRFASQFHTQIRARSANQAMPQDTLTRLAGTIAARRAADAGSSYTRKLLDAGPAECARKLGEEAVETVIAALAQDADALKSEAADLLYHLLVLLEARGVALDDVYNVLEVRMGKSGLAEKASRSRPQDE